MLWIGNSLGRIEHLSIASFLGNGHRVRVHAYGDIQGLPSKVELAEAETTVPYELMAALRHQETGSFALASDYFRYRLQETGAGLWSDLDVVCLKPLVIDSDSLFGMENKRKINGAILYLEAGLPITTELAGLFRENFIPRWTRLKYALPLKVGGVFGRNFGPADLPWGTYGPLAITALARKHGLFRKAKPRDVFYPLRFRHAQSIFDPAASLDNVLTERTVTIHLWNEALKELKKTVPPHGSPLAKLLTEFGV
ncbi:hypothetical protein [Borborobacter arsenicus]|nr:hypothetical protein [Pseudaminobacter arsenicus]